jgi:hypothetical protein
VNCTITGAALALLARDGAVLPTPWHILEAHGRARTPTEHDIGGSRLRVLAGEPHGLVVGVVGIDNAAQRSAVVRSLALRWAAPCCA